MNLFRLHNHLVLTLDDGTQFKTDNCTDEFEAQVVASRYDKEALIALFNPTYAAAKSLADRIAKSKVLTLEGASIYIKSISQLTVPQDFAEKIIDAEEAGDQDKLTAYLNFWTLLSLNPDSRVRNNTFWFINKWNIKLTKSGLIIAYRNADIYSEGSKFNKELTKFVTQKYWEKKQSTIDNPEGYIVVMRDDDYFITGEDYELDDEDVYIGDLVDLYTMLTTDNSEQTTVFTDHYSRTFRIRLGHIVQMDRSKTDSDQTHTCSSGLHCASKDWLESNYYGTVGMRVLVNPANIVAIPPEDSYGKMRTCAYYPVSIVNYGIDGHIIDENIEDGFEDDFINKICYTGTVNNEDNDNYRLDIPEISEIDKTKVYSRLKELAASIQRTV